MIVGILMTYLILMCWWCYSWIRENVWLKIKTKKQLIFTIFAVFTFIFIFVFFLRLLRLFKEHKTIDIWHFYYNYGFFIVCIFIILLYSLRRLLVYLFKIMWFRMHYFLLSPFNLPRIYTFYNKFHYKFIYNPFIKIYKVFKIANIFLNLGLIFFLFKDIVFNHGILDQSLMYLRYYSVLKLIYILSKFMFEKQILILDYYFYNMSYTMDPEHPFNFIKCKKHIELQEESIRYKNYMIFEYSKFLPKKIDYTDNGYYRYINNKSTGDIPVTVIRITSLEQLDEILRKK